VAFFINMFTVYILYSIKFDRFYKGQTSDLNRRLKEHNNQEEKSTANFVPWILVWHKLVSTRSEAVILEKKLKNITSKKRIRDFIKRNTN
jgi:putative endonuclease